MARSPRLVVVVDLAGRCCCAHGPADLGISGVGANHPPVVGRSRRDRRGMPNDRRAAGMSRAGASAPDAGHPGPLLGRALAASRAVAGPGVQCGAVRRPAGDSRPRADPRPRSRPRLERCLASDVDRTLVPSPRLRAPVGTRGGVRRRLRLRGGRLARRRDVICSHPGEARTRGAGSAPCHGLAMARTSDVRRRIESLHRTLYRLPLLWRHLVPAMLVAGALLLIVGGLGITRGQQARTTEPRGICEGRQANRD